MLLVERLERDLIQDGIATASLSAATFKPKLSKSRSLTSRLKSEVTIDRWENDLQKLVDANLVQTEGNHRFWRMSLRVPALSNMDYGKLLDDVETRVNDEIARLVAARWRIGPIHWRHTVVLPWAAASDSEGSEKQFYHGVPVDIGGSGFGASQFPRDWSP